MPGGRSRHSKPISSRSHTSASGPRRRPAARSSTRQIKSPRLWLGLTGTASGVSIRSRTDSGALRRGADTRTLAGSRGYALAGVGPVLTFDSRDDIYYSGSGVYAQLSSAANLVRDRVRQRAHGFGRATADIRTFFTIGGHSRTRYGLPRQVLATQIVVDQTIGVTPFDLLPSFGGTRLLRGELDGRFRDATAVATQLEWRQAIANRWFATVFAGAGAVAPAADALSLGDTRVAAGAGVRWLLIPATRLTVRADLGRSRDGTGLYFALGESF
jgi:hypothetical protein